MNDDRDAVRRLLTEADAFIQSADSETANEVTADAEVIVKRWDAAGQLVEFLSPLLDTSETDPVRFGAASYLLHLGHADLAVPVLESLDMLGADVLLADWRRRQQGSPR
jgi:hypothetical protein